MKNIVLVHGAWADGSGWKGVYDILVKDGYNVSIVQDPLLLTGFLPVANRVQTGFGAKPLNWRINIRT